MTYYSTPEPRGLGKNSRTIQSINRLIQSPWGVCMLGLRTFVAFVFSLEVVFYTFVVLYSIYVALFADDFTPMMPLFVLCYIAPSRINNPGKNPQSIFFGETGLYLIGIVAIGVLFLLGRIIFDKEMGLRRLFTTKRTLLVGMLILGAAYFLSGILNPHYIEVAANNLRFAAIQFASIFLLYFIFSATIDWDNFDTDYFATIGVVVGLVVSAELIWGYLINPVVTGGIIDFSQIYTLYTGWGNKNNMGAMITTAIPFAFYFASRKAKPLPYFGIACFLLFAVFVSCSRTSIITAVCIFMGALVFTFFKCENKLEFRLYSLLLVGAVGIVAWIFREQLGVVFSSIPSAFVFNENSVNINDSNRVEIFQTGINVFLNNPIFGQSFFPIEYDELTAVHVQYIPQFKDIVPERWHNTIIQMLASCGIVGLAAYLYHRFDTFRLYFSKPHATNTYIGFYITTLLAMSLLDCHFFNIGPVLFYSMALAVAEFAPETSTYDI